MKMFQADDYLWINLDQVVQVQYSVNSLSVNGGTQTRHALVVYLAAENQVVITARDVINRFMSETNAPGWKAIETPNPWSLLVARRSPS
jgi:hypothetical protein